MFRMQILFLALLAFAQVHAGDDLPASHLKPFGWGKAVPLEEVEGFLPVKRFFDEYALPNKPVVMRGANKVWPGFHNWQTDDYFMKIAPKEPFIISMDIKRGSPETPTDYVDFKEFLQKYNVSNRRMVEHTPEFLWKDVFVPGSLSCDEITQGEVLMGHKIWYGTNYTTSVVHKDAADNINCLVYGRKVYTALSPKYAKYVYMDRPDGLYSTMEVDKVDATKYPGLDNVEYQTTELRGGDCVFLPYKWIHQVRSYGRNIAVNVWWNHWKNSELDLSQCSPEPVKKPIASALFHGWGDFEKRDEGVREHTHDLLSMANVLKPVSYPRWVALFTSGTLDEEGVSPMEILRYVDSDIKKALREAFVTIDLNKDKRISPSEMDALPEEEVAKVVSSIKYVLHESRVRSQKYEDDDKEQQKKYEENKDTDSTPPGLSDDDDAGRENPENELKHDQHVENERRHDEF